MPGSSLLSMNPFLFRCPVTGYTVQALAPDRAVEDDDEEAAIQVACGACGRTHFVKPESGEPVGE